MCIDAHKKCNKSDSCKRLYEDWERKSMDVWEPTTEICSNECKNATVELYNDWHGEDVTVEHLVFIHLHYQKK